MEKRAFSTAPQESKQQPSLDLEPFKKQIEDIVKGSDVVLFMKGHPEAPQVHNILICFSRCYLFPFTT